MLFTWHSAPSPSGGVANVHITSGESGSGTSLRWQPSSLSDSKPLSVASAICDGPALWQKRVLRAGQYGIDSPFGDAP